MVRLESTLLWDWEVFIEVLTPCCELRASRLDLRRDLDLKYGTLVRARATLLKVLGSFTLKIARPNKRSTEGGFTTLAWSSLSLWPHALDCST